jgi:hypothetical protein
MVHNNPRSVETEKYTVSILVYELPVISCSTNVGIRQACHYYSMITSSDWSFHERKCSSGILKPRSA